MQIPTLHTSRLILRAPQISDFPEFAAFYASDRARFVGGPMTSDNAWRMLATEIGHWTLRGYGRWALEERETGAFCGVAGLWYPAGWPEPEVGWDLMNGFEGRGYATEAGEAARCYAYETVGLPTLISVVAHGNTGSASVARRLGATFERDMVHSRFGQVQVWRHPAPETLT